MAIIKCKMCGGDLNVVEDATVCECEYCGTKQTVPKADDEKKLTLFARAGRLLRACEFDKAAGVFETIVADFSEEAEAYWGLVLCKYGIEYVDDPATGKKIPTCHRSSFDSVMKDANFEQACENTDAVARRVYRDEARAIEELRKSIIEVSDKEEPYDVFISYKEKDANGERTKDSVIAQEIYRELTREGYRVFFSRISLENRLGTEYEPYIFAALNSARVMIVVGTDYENFDAVWVKNEWSRYLKLIAKGERKTLIPVFKDMDAYDMPEEFNKLTALDMGKVGAVQDLVHGVEKIVGKKKTEPAPARQPVYVNNETDAKTASAVTRGNLALEDGEFDKAKEFYEQALALDAECAEAYLGLALANEKCRDEQEYIDRACVKKGAPEMLLVTPDTRRVEKDVRNYVMKNFLTEETICRCFAFDLRYPSTVKSQVQVAALEKAGFENNRNIRRAFRFAKGETANRLNTFKAQLFEGLDRTITEAKEKEESARVAKVEAYAKHLNEAEEKAAKLHRDAEAKRERAYETACEAQKKAESANDYKKAIEVFRLFEDYKDSRMRIDQCGTAIRKITEQERLKKDTEAKAAAEEIERQQIAAEKAAKKHRKTIAVITTILIACIAVSIVLTTVIIPNIQHKEAVAKYSKAFEDASVGDVVIFGTYEQDNNTANGQEDIEWLVLAKEDGRILIISKYALDCRKYSRNYLNGTWETCSLRKWLNRNFLNKAFNAGERAMIPSVTVSADENAKYNLTSPGNNTMDKVFLLSITEANKYYSIRMCQGTDYVYAQGKLIKYESLGCRWWLRSPGMDSYYAAYVNSDGSISYLGACRYVDYEGVRPALWIEYES